MDKARLSIIIVSWNVKSYLKGCLESIFTTLKNNDFEIFVVDNNSEDSTAGFVKERFPQVTLIENKDNPGFAKANNQAIRMSKGEYILLLNPDTSVLANALNEMVNFMDKNHDFGAVGPMILCEDGRSVSNCGGRKFPSIKTIFYGLTTLDRISRYFENHSLNYRDHKDSREVDVLSGACLMVRREAIDEVGLLDENFFMYAEDIDWCYRIKKAGWKIFYLAEATIVHYGERSAVKKFSETDNMLENFKTYFKYFDKHYGLFYALCYRSMLVVTMIGWNILWSIRLLGAINNKEKARQIITRNNRFIKWGISTN